MLRRVICNGQLKIIPRSISCTALRGLHYDVVIAGGGVMGSSTAYFLKNKNPQLKVAVVERDLSYEKSASALSVASIRQQFSTVENISLSQWSWDFMSRIGEFLTVDASSPPDVQMWRGAYMFLATQRGYNILKNNCRYAQGKNLNLAKGSSTNYDY